MIFIRVGEVTYETSKINFFKDYIMFEAKERGGFKLIIPTCKIDYIDYKDAAVLELSDNHGEEVVLEELKILE